MQRVGGKVDLHHCTSSPVALHLSSQHTSTTQWMNYYLFRGTVPGGDGRRETDSLQLLIVSMGPTDFTFGVQVVSSRLSGRVRSLLEYPVSMT